MFYNKIYYKNTALFEPWCQREKEDKIDVLKFRIHDHLSKTVSYTTLCYCRKLELNI